MGNDSNHSKNGSKKTEGISMMMAVSRVLQFDNISSENKIWNDILHYVHYLEDSGVSKSDRVMISADNSYEFILAVFALIHIDCSIVLVDSSLDEGEVLKIAKHSNSRFCICDRFIHQNEVSIQMLELSYDHSTEELLKGKIDMGAWEQRKDALILYTSGSTGNPKGIIKSGKSFLINIRATIKRMEYNPSDVLLPLIPFTHFYGLSIIFIWWITKCDLVLCNYRNMRAITNEIAAKKVTVVDAVPSMFYMLNRLFAKRRDLLNNIKNSKVRMWCVGGSPLSKKLSREFHSYIQMPLLDGYGLSEAGNVALNIKGTEFGCGKALEGVQIKVINSDGNELPFGQTGEILVKSPGVMEKYHKLEQATNSVLQNGWLKTNDLGYFDQSGNLFVIGRKGDEILRKGYIIHPASIEKTLEDRLGIKCKVVSFKDEKKGSIIILMVEADDDTGQLRDKITHSLDAISKPDKIHIMKHFPYLNNGKIDYKSIKNLSIQLNNKIVEGEICQLELH